MILSDRARAWLRRRLEKATDTFYEGPRPPARLRTGVLAFANAHPSATREDWAAFAASLAEEAWRSAFIRGVEHVEREPPDHPLRPSPDDYMDEIDPEWRWSPAVDLENPNEVVPEDVPEGERIERQFRAAGMRIRRF